MVDVDMLIESRREDPAGWDEPATPLDRLQGIQNCPRCGGRPHIIEYPLGIACVCPVKDMKMPIYVADSEAKRIGFNSFREAWNALRSTDDPSTLLFQRPARSEADHG